MYLKGIIIFCLVVVHEPLFCYGKFSMADDPILEHLKMEPETEYEFLGKDFLHQLEKRDIYNETRVKVYTKDESIDLLLHPRNSNLVGSKAYVYLVCAYKELVNQGGVMFFPNDELMPNVSQLLLEDPAHLASLIINKDENNRSTVNGVIRSKRHDANLVIRSLPDSVVQEHLRKRRSTNASVDEDLSQSQHHTNHVILKIKDGEALEKDVHQAVSEAHRYTKRDIQTGLNRTLYLKLLIHLDSTYFDKNYTSFWDLRVMLFEKRRELISLMEYVFAFWNSVELAYRNLENPTIQLNIGTIVMAPSVEATPYIRKSINSTTGRVNYLDAIDRAASFYYTVNGPLPFHTYNLVITMTKLKFSGTVIGAAIKGSICSFPWGSKTQDAVAMVHDSYGFSGIRAAIHEIGHALGLDHDDYSDRSCSREEGFIMAPSNRGTDKSSLFSPCSLAQLRKALIAGKLKCLYDPPYFSPKETSLPLLAAGKIFNMDQQCQALNYTKACGFDTENFCRRLSCHMGYTEVHNRPTEICGTESVAAPGTSCNAGNGGELGICFMNRCVAANQPDDENETDR